jgi:hypothetical protein
VGGGADQPVWPAVDLCPAGRGHRGGRAVQIRQQRAQVKEAPNIEPDGQLSEAEEAELYRHYGLDYDAVTAEGDTAAGDTGTGLAGQVAGPAIDQPTRPPAAGADRNPRPAVDQPTDTAGASTLAGSPSGGPVETESDGQPGPPTRPRDRADSDQGPTAETSQGDQWRRDAGADDAPAAGMTEPSRATSQDPFRLVRG